MDLIASSGTESAELIGLRLRQSGLWLDTVLETARHASPNDRTPVTTPFRESRSHVGHDTVLDTARHDQTSVTARHDQTLEAPVLDTARHDQTLEDLGSARDHTRDNTRDGPSSERDFEDAASRIARKLHGLAKGIRDEPVVPPPKPAMVDLACLTGIPVEMLRAYLRAVASVGNVDAIKAVLTSDPLVIDSRDSSGWTALHHAARYGMQH